MGCPTPRHTDWLTVNRKVTLTSTQIVTRALFLADSSTNQSASPSGRPSFPPLLPIILYLIIIFLLTELLTIAIARWFWSISNSNLWKVKRCSPVKRQCSFRRKMCFALCNITDVYLFIALTVRIGSATWELRIDGNIIKILHRTSIITYCQYLIANTTDCNDSNCMH
jgi:hypothetical protein